MPSPIERMIDQACLQCVKCGAKRGTCDCFERCACGIWFERGGQCRSRIHEPVNQLVDGLMADIDNDLSTRKFVRRDMLERVVRRHAAKYLLDCFTADDDAKRKR